MSIETLKDNAVDFIKTARTAAVNGACWTYGQAKDGAIWMGRTVVSWDLPGKAAAGAKWTASAVQSIWNFILPKIAAFGAFLTSTTGLAICSGAGAIGLIAASEKYPAIHDNENFRRAAQVGALALAFIAGVLI